MIRFSANLGFLWSDRDLLARIDAAAAAGFKAIELHWPYATQAHLVRERCAAYGVVLLGINTPPGERRGDFGLGALPGREEEFRASFHVALKYAEASGASAIHVLAGLTHNLDRRLCADTLERTLDYAARQTDLTLLLEPINQRDKPGYFYSTIAEATKIAARVGASNLKIMFDVYHIAVSEGDITRKLETFVSNVGHVQIAAVPSRAEPDEGEIDYRHILKTLERIGYNGWVGCEYLPRDATDEGLGWVAALGSHH
jgi:hydroxypyruvate isomerase